MVFKFYTHYKDRRRLHIWAGLWNLEVIGPEEFPYTLKGEDYLEFLNNSFQMIIEHIPEEELKVMWYQLDGAPAHYYKLVRDKLDRMFPDRWIGRLGPTMWPARSPDLNPCDFFLWGFIKEKIYSEDYEDFVVLRQKIQAAIDSITPEMLERVHQNFIKRCRKCIECLGGHFEHLIK